MRNLISLAIAFAVTLTEDDVLELGYNVEEAEFRTYFEIPEDAVQGEFKKETDFSPQDIVQFMNAEESSEFAPAQEAAPAETPAAKPAAKPETAAAKKKREKAEAAAAATNGTDAPAPAATAEPKKPGVIASILEVITNAEKPVGETEILAELVKRFPDKEAASMHKTIKAQLGGKAQPLRMEQEKGVKFELTTTTPKEGEKAQRLYAIAK